MSIEHIGHESLNAGKNKINANFDELQTKANAAVSTSNAAKTTADTAKITADNVKAEFDQVIIEGDSSVEAAAARVNADASHSYGNLKERLDTEYNAVNAHLAEKANQADMNVKFGSMGSTKTFKGSCLNSALPISGMAVDDYWFVSDLNTNKAWNGTSWVDIGNVLKIGNGTIVKSYLSFPIIDGVPSINLFNKMNVTNGYYISPASGNSVANAAYCASENIPVTAGTAYMLDSPDQGVWRNSANVRISGFDGSTVWPQTAPIGAAYVQFSTPIANVNVRQLEVGSAKTTYAPFGSKIPDDSMSDALVINLEKTLKPYLRKDYLKSVRQHLDNAFVRTIIKLVGDSITAGQGGTGFSGTGDLIPGTSSHMNLTTGVCWANMLYDFVDNKYNKETYVAMNDENITITAPSTFAITYASLYKLQSYLLLNNTTNNGTGIEFSMYGDHFSVFYEGNPAGGVLAIYVDDVLVDTLDSYMVTLTRAQEKAITGLTLAEHTIKIVETNTKNASSGGKTVKIEALKIFKTAQVINWGISGIASASIWSGRATRITADDNFCMIQVGTNDRATYISPAATRSNLTAIIEYINDSTTVKPILMSANPSSVANDALGNFKMNDVDIAVGDVAERFGMPYISNYDAFMKYAENTGTALDSLVDSGGLHPNDLGYLVMYNNIARSIGLPILRDGITP